MAQGPGSDVLAGRDRELERARAVATSRARTNRTLVVTGPAGIGRTSLLRAAVADLDAAVLWASASITSGAEPWAALRNARAGAAATPDFDFDPSGGDELVREALEGRLTPAEVGRRVVARRQAQGSHDRPVVVVVDDLHRCDPLSLELLLFLAHRTHTFDVSYLLGCPTAALPASAADLERVELVGLDPAAGRAALAAWTGATVDAPTAATLTHLVDGNPRVLRETAARLSPAQLAGRRSLPPRLPLTPGAARATEPLLADLGEAELRVLACFHLGLDVPRAVLAQVVDLATVRDLEDRRLLESVPGGHRCPSTLLARGAESRLEPGRRSELAAGLAAAWATLDPVRSALHASEEGLPNDEVLARGRTALAAPGTDPATGGRLGEALAWAVVERADPPSARDWLVLVERAERAGHLDDACEAFERAVRAPVVDEADLAVLTRRRGFLSQVLDDRALAVPSARLASSLEHVRPPVVFETTTRTAWNSLLVGAHGEARTYLDRARTASRAARTTDRALWRLVDVAWQRGAADLRGDTLREAALRWRDSAEEREWYDDFLLATVLLEAGAALDARQHLYSAASAHRHAGRLATHFLLAARLQVEVALLEVPSALVTAAELDRGAVPGPAHVRGLPPALVRLETLAGLPAGTLGSETSYASEAGAVAWALAERALVEGRFPEAAVGLEAVLRSTPRLPLEARRSALADLVEAQVAVGDLGAARETAARLLRLEPADRPSAAAARAGALVATSLETRGAFARALEVADAEGGLLGRARTLLALSRRLRATGAEDEADRTRDEAALIFAHHGIEGWRRHAGHPATVTPGSAAPGRLVNTRLDDHEAGIVRLLLLGQKNREVAAGLYVSLRSLEKSLTRIYAKTGVSSKAQLLALVRAETGDAGGGPGGR